MKTTGAELDNLIADLLAENLVRFKGELLEFITRRIDDRALPPFTPPAVWTAGRHGAGTVVRHCNGLFSARRDTDEEPPSSAWLPLLVGISGIDFRWTGDRTMHLFVALSDGTVVETSREFTLPIARGFWQAEENYREGDRVLRFGDWQCAIACRGIDPNGVDNTGQWLKVTGKQHREIIFKLDDDGRMFENGHQIGSIKPLVSDLLKPLMGGRA